MKKNVRHASHQDILEWNLIRNTVTNLDKLFSIAVVLKFVKLIVNNVQLFVIVIFCVCDKHIILPAQHNTGINTSHPISNSTIISELKTSRPM